MIEAFDTTKEIRNITGADSSADRLLVISSIKEGSFWARRPLQRNFRVRGRQQYWFDFIGLHLVLLHGLFLNLIRRVIFLELLFR